MSVGIGETAPDFETDTTTGRIRLHDWADGDWVFFFSHPADFTPVGTTEMGVLPNRPSGSPHAASSPWD